MSQGIILFLCLWDTKCHPLRGSEGIIKIIPLRGYKTFRLMMASTYLTILPTYVNIDHGHYQRMLVWVKFLWDDLVGYD